MVSGVLLLTVECVRADSRLGSVCRYDIAAAARAAVLIDDRADFEILHVATVDTGLPHSERASAVCNVGRTMSVLGVSFEHDLSRFE